MRPVTDYNKDILISKEESSNQKKFYELEVSNGKIIVSLIDGLSKFHFSDNLYNGVKQGSKRWWVLERRKFDHNKFYSKRNHKIFPKKEIDNHELEWNKKVADFYSILENGYVESSSFGSNSKCPSKYILKKYYDNSKILTKEEVIKIGLTDDNKPLFYRIILDEKGHEVDVKCNVEYEDVCYGLECKKYTQLWWVFKRMRFDFGFDCDFIKAPKEGDLNGVVNKSYLLSCNLTRSFFDIHEESWSRYVDVIFKGKKREEENKDKEITYEEKINHNVIVLKKMSEPDFNRMIIDYPMILLENTPFYLYQEIMIYIINKMRDDNRIKPIPNNSIKDFTESLIKQISNFVYKSSFNNRIDIFILKQIVNYNPNLVETIFKYFANKSIMEGMVRRQFVDVFMTYIRLFRINKINPYGDECISLEEQLKYFSVNSPLISEFEKEEKRMNDFCKEIGLYRV